MPRRPKNSIQLRKDKLNIYKLMMKDFLTKVPLEFGLVVSEFKFLPDRKFRFDYAIPSKKIAFEYEGVFSRKSGHTTLIGYTKDCEKYNLAVLGGWKVLRYTAMNIEDLKRDLTKLVVNNS